MLLDIKEDRDDPMRDEKLQQTASSANYDTKVWVRQVTWSLG